MIYQKDSHLQQLIWLTVVNREQDFLSFFLVFCVSLIQGIDRDETGLARLFHKRHKNTGESVAIGR